MGIFEEQLRERLKRDDAELSHSIDDVIDSLRGKSRYHADGTSMENLRHELELICQFYKVDIPSEFHDTKDVNEFIDYMTHPSGIMHRRVMLEGNWWKDCDGALLAVTKDKGEFCALLPRKTGGYSFWNTSSGAREKLTSKHKDMFEKEALCFYEPLPEEVKNGKQLLFFLFKHIAIFDYAIVLLATLLATLLGMMTPYISGIIFSRLIPSGKTDIVFTTAILLLITVLAAYIMSVVRTGTLERIKNRMENVVQNALMSKLMHLPPRFFQRKSAGGLATIITYLDRLPMVIADVLLGPFITAVFSFAYVIQIGVLAPSLALPAFVTLIVQALIIIFSIKQKLRLTREELNANMEVKGITYSAISGIQRIKLSGSEKRIVSRWAKAYKNRAKAAYKVYFPSTMQNELVVAAALAGTLWVYFSGASRGIELSQFVVFLSAFSIATNNITSLSECAQHLPFLKPSLKLIEPILSETPETSAGKTVVGRLSGAIEMSHVTFRYSEKSPVVLDDLNLKIKPREYIAIVGRSGCGKSTLMRLLMGFEKPESGMVMYDQKDLAELDPASLRRNIGVVLQNGKLFAGSIFSNITISAPWLTLKEAWEAAEMAGMADDIRNMPMGMHTLISEGSGGISGGQKQRLMIARAIAPKPKILMFDEATSALDNITQKKVSDTLDTLNCTRVVIAHRLSTIRNCDRILVMDKGKIAEDGSYDELIAKNGLFAELVERQRL
ncbi:MAG: ATP-binding cassette domain-containing protein [Clostridia bacterium]|nr:ATP-binding cassette domain-containing protein [Clostridia bacterium]